jgi:hypothetical protein
MHKIICKKKYYIFIPELVGELSTGLYKRLENQIVKVNGGQRAYPAFLGQSEHTNPDPVHGHNVLLRKVAQRLVSVVIEHVAQQPGKVGLGHEFLTHVKAHVELVIADCGRVQFHLVQTLHHLVAFR